MLELFTLLFCFFGADRKNFCVRFPGNHRTLEPIFSVSNCQILSVTVSFLKVLNLGCIVFSALMLWKGLMVVTKSESPVAGSPGCY